MTDASRPATLAAYARAKVPPFRCSRLYELLAERRLEAAQLDALERKQRTRAAAAAKREPTGAPPEWAYTERAYVTGSRGDSTCLARLLRPGEDVRYDASPAARAGDYLVDRPAPPTQGGPGNIPQRLEGWSRAAFERVWRPA